MKLSFIGGGAMAEALIGGILAKGIAQAQDIWVGEPVQVRRDELQQRFAVNVSATNPNIAPKGEMVVLAVKPQTLLQAMNELKGRLKAEQTVLSIVAGATIESISRGLGHDAVIRVMPNAPAKCGAAMSVWTASTEVADEAKAGAKAVLKSLGEELYVADEHYLDMATAINGSGPAYVFLFLEALVDAGVYIGMSRDMAKTVALQTLLGSAVMAKETGLHPAQLRDMVASPGGTTVEALLALEEGGFRSAVWNAVIAAYEKSRFLGKERD